MLKFKLKRAIALNAKRAALMLFFMLSFTMVNAQLSGTYSIGASGTYTTIGAAVTDLQTNGVSGPVVFQIANGTYNEQIRITEISGASATNTITFTSASGDSSKVYWYYASSASATNYTLQLDSADYFLFKNLTIAATGTTYGRVVELKNGAGHNSFTNNIIRGVTSTLTTTPNNRANIYSGTTVDSNNVFASNRILRGSEAIDLSGAAKGIEITNNIIDSAYVRGIDLTGVNAPLISGNTITNIQNSTGYGIHLVACTNAFKILNNKLSMLLAGYGIYPDDCIGTSTDRGLIANNFVTQLGGTGTSMGIYLNSSSYIDIVYNNVRVASTSATAGRAFYATGSSSATYNGNRIFNNVFVNAGSGYAYQITSAGVTSGIVDTSDHNDLYIASTSTNLVNWNGTSYTSLSAYQAASNQDPNSISVDPKFTSSTDLHVKAVSLNAAATPFSGITTDIEGQLRNSTTPDIGADEFNPPSIDASINKIASPVTPVCGSTVNVVARVRNSGIDRIDTISLTYVLDGVVQSTTKYTISLLSAGDTDLVVGTISPSSTVQSVKVYLTNPNGDPDPNNANDTGTATIQAGLSGSYSIGASGDYNSFGAAVSALTSRGVCGPVTFNVADGIYTEQVSIPEVLGASSTNTITFTSASNDSSKVVLTYASASASANNFTLKLDGADHLIFSKLTIQRSNGSTTTYGRVVEISGGAGYNTFTRNIINGVTSTSTTTTSNRANFYSSSTLDSNNTFTNNYILRGSDGFAYDAASAAREKGTVIANNIFDSVYSRGIDMTYQDAPQITGNVIRNILGTTGYGIYLADCFNGIKVTENKIVNNVGGYGIRLEDGIATASDRALIANNFISHLAGTSTSYGIYLDASVYFDIVYNSVLISSSSTTAGRALYATGTVTGSRIFNNNFTNFGAGYAYYIAASSVTTLDTSDNNNFYSAGSNLVNYDGTAYSTLASYQAATTWDANSVSVDPEFVSSTELWTDNIALNAAATPISTVTTDIDGDLRNSTTPDIGADEFVPPANDLSLTLILEPIDISCGTSATDVKVVVANMGTSTQNNFDVEVVVSGAGSQTLKSSYTGTLASGASDTITLSSINSLSGGRYNLKAYAVLSTDEERSNDTLLASIILNPVPSAPTVKDGNHCGNGEIVLVGTPGKDEITVWYESPSSTKPLDTTEIFTTPVLSSTDTFYAEAMALGTGKVGPKDYLSVSSTGAFNVFTNAMKFDAEGIIHLDSVKVFGNDTGTVIMEILDASSNLLKTVTHYIKGSPSGDFIPINLTIPAGTGYQMKLWNSNVNLWRNSAGANYPYKGPQLSITGTTSTSSYYYFYDWHYSYYACSSPRVPVVATVNPGMGGAENIKSSPFEGTYATGTEKDPDLVCAESTIAYEVTPPTGFSNADFGTTWAISSLDFETASGTPAKDTTLTIPSANTNGKITFTPVSSLGDSMFILTATFVDLKTGCDSVSMRYIKVLPLPEPAFTATSVCLGESVSITDQSKGASSYLYRFGDGNTSPDVSPNHTYAAAGKYDITQIITNASGCMDSTTVTVTVFELPVADFSFPTNDSNYVCTGAQVVFTDASTTTNTLSHAWSFGDGNTSIDASPTHTYTTEGTYEVKLVVTNANGCKDSTTKTINVEMQPVADFTATDACDGEAVSFTDNSTVGSGQIFRVYDFGDGNSSMDLNPTHTYAQAGSYTVTYMVMGMGACMDTQVSVINVFDRAQVGFSYVSDCDQKVNFNDTSVLTTSAIIDRTWYFGDGNSVTTFQDPAASHTYALAGNYDVKLVVTTLNGCIDSATFQVVVLDRPEADFVSNKAVFCLGETTVFTNQSTGTNLTHTWNFGDNSTSADESPSHTYAAAGNYTVWLVTTNADGCKDSSSTSITVNDVPVAGFTADTVCLGKTTKFTGSPAGAASYEWNFGDGSKGNTQSPVHTYAAAGTYTVTLKVKNGAGCEDSVTSSVVVNALPNASFTYTTTFLAANFKPQDTTLTTYAWSFGDSSVSTTMKSTHTYASEGTYTVWLVTVNANGCADSTSQLVTVQANGIADVKAAPLSVNVYPNPFSSTAKVEFNLDRPQVVNITIHDLTGKELGIITNCRQAEGNHNFIINAESYNMSAGTYLIKVQAGDKQTVKRLILTK